MVEPNPLSSTAGFGEKRRQNEPGPYLTRPQRKNRPRECGIWPMAVTKIQRASRLFVHEPASALARIAMSSAAVLASIPDPPLHRFEGLDASG